MAYRLQRTFPQLHDTASFVLVALAILAFFAGMYFATRRYVFLMIAFSVTLYLIPFFR
jgi:hypothetical protein